MTERYLQMLEQAARLIVAVLESIRIEDEDKSIRIRDIRERLTLAVSQNENGAALMGDVEEEKKEKGTFQITDEEIKKMSKTIKGKFFTHGFAVCWRKRPTGKDSFTYQVRFQREGYNIQFHDKHKGNLKPRFLLELQKQERYRQDTIDGVPTTFSRFALYYFEKFRKVKVAAETYKTDSGRLQKYLLPYFVEKPLRNITPSDCQRLLDEQTKEGKGKTADELFSLMNGIFNCAIKHHILQFNPLDTVVHSQHEREEGVALTPFEERAFVREMKKSEYCTYFAVMLYCGLRPCEYESARIEGSFIVSFNRKRKNGKIEYKKIPISPMLRPYLADMQELCFPSVKQIRLRFKKILPHHTLKDLRTTFNTRCQECNVEPPARKAFMGHSQGSKLDDTYTKLSEEYLLKEGEKLNY